MKIFVEVHGGVVQSVFTDSEELIADVVIVDWDNIEQGDPEPDQPIKNNRFYIY